MIQLDNVANAQFSFSVCLRFFVIHSFQSIGMLVVTALNLASQNGHRFEDFPLPVFFPYSIYACELLRTILNANCIWVWFRCSQILWSNPVAV